MSNNEQMKNLALLTIIISVLNVDLFAQVSRHFNKEKKPKYELGAGLINLNIPNYPGASANTPRYVPFPWFIYRGDFLRSDEEGTRAKFIDSEAFELGLSGGFNFAIKSEENEARRGMDDKDALVGIGPNILIRILKKNPLHRLTFGVGLRVNYATRALSFKNEGWVIEPKLRYWRKFSKEGKLTFFSGITASFGDQKYNAFFYDVDEEYVNADRAAYRSREGLVDITGSMGIGYDFSKKASVFAGTFYSNLSLAANKDSFLVEEEHNSGLIVGFAWLFYESNELVK